MPMTTKAPTSMPAATETYAAAFAVLSGIAERLRTASGAATVDSLVADVQAAQRAHAVCKARLDAVRREIDAEVAATDHQVTG